LDGTRKGAGVRDKIEDPHNTCFTSLVTLAEVVSKFIRGGRDPRVVLKALEDNSNLQTVDLAVARLAGEIHAEVKKKVADFGLADAFVLATARSKGFKVLTGDPHFKTIPEAIMI
jgi:predicted nucleic acid-binding protein